MNEILDLFVKYNPDFLEKLNSFPEALKIKLFEKLNASSDDAIFLSYVSEINFGLLFNGLGFNLQYDKTLSSGKKPDWEISYQNMKAICEVYRLGQSAKDQNITNFDNKLKRGFGEINYGYKIRYSLHEDYVIVDDMEVESIISELTNWLSNNRKISDILLLDNKIKFEILSLNQTNKLTYSTIKSIDYKPEKLVQKDYMKRDNEVSKKLSKYSTSIKELGVPYFICIESDFKNGLNFEEFANYFLGSYCMYTEDDIIINCEKEIEYSKLGCLYDHITVSGIIIKIGNDYRKILNPLKKQLIYNKDNYQIINKINMIENASA
jgi:hypothetical protein